MPPRPPWRGRGGLLQTRQPPEQSDGIIVVAVLEQPYEGDPEHVFGFALHGFREMIRLERHVAMGTSGRSVVDIDHRLLSTSRTIHAEDRHATLQTVPGYNTGWNRTSDDVGTYF